MKKPADAAWGAARGHVDDDRCCGLQEAREDLSHRLHLAARRGQLDDQGLRPDPVSLRGHLCDELGDDDLDHGVHGRHDHFRRGLGDRVFRFGGRIDVRRRHRFLRLSGDGLFRLSGFVRGSTSAGATASSGSAATDSSDSPDSSDPGSSASRTSGARNRARANASRKRLPGRVSFSEARISGSLLDERAPVAGADTRYRRNGRGERT